MTKPEAETLASLLAVKGLGVEVVNRGNNYCFVKIPFVNVDFQIVKPVTINKIVEDMEDLIGLLK